MRGILVALTSASIVVSMSTAAVADSTTVRDPKGDVFVSSSASPDEADPAGSVVNTDVLRTKVKHQKQWLRLVITYKSLAARKSSYISYDAEIRVPNGDIYHGLTVVNSKVTKGSVQVTDDEYVVDEACSGGRVTVRRSEDRILVRIPRGCLGNPRWVRVGGTALSIPKGAPKKSYFDNALPDGAKVTERLFAG